MAPGAAGRNFIAFYELAFKVTRGYFCHNHRPVLCLSLSCVSLFATPWTVESMGFSRLEYWSGLLCLPPGDLPDPGIETVYPTSPALAGGFFTTSTTLEALISLCCCPSQRLTDPDFTVQLVQNCTQLHGVCRLHRSAFHLLPKSWLKSGEWL